MFGCWHTENQGGFSGTLAEGAKAAQQGAVVIWGRQHQHGHQQHCGASGIAGCLLQGLLKGRDLLRAARRRSRGR